MHIQNEILEMAKNGHSRTEILFHAQENYPHVWTNKAEQNFNEFIDQVDSMKLEILVEIKNVYGNEKIYPACEKASLFCDIAGTKTITDETKVLIKQLGYTIIVNQAVKTL